MNKSTLNIDGRIVDYISGETILEAARRAGIYTIPTLCHLKDTKPTGSCRVCVVEVEGWRTLAPACATAAAAGMVIKTDSERVTAARKMVIELLLASGNHNCLICEANGECELQALAYRYNIPAPSFAFPPETPYHLEDNKNLIRRDLSKCIMCGRCVRACKERQVNNAISIGYRGSHNKIVTMADSSYGDSDCVFCGECVQACPVGALVALKSVGLGRPWETTKVRTTCPYCGVGCQQLLHVRNGKIIKVTGAEDGAPNKGRLCVKGRFGYDFIYSPDRLTTPLIKSGDGFREASWDEALDLVAGKIKEIVAKHGPDACAGISCARSINEDSYQMQKLFRVAIGTNNIDHCARICHAPTVAGLAASFGSGAMTNSFADFAKAKMFYITGSNMTEAHPVAATFVKNAVRNGAQLIVADPRRVKLAEFADIYAPIKVGSDVAFINGLMHVLITENLYDKDYVERCCTGFEALKAKVMEYPPERAAAIAGVSVDMLKEVARRLASVKPAILIYTLGITEHTCGVHNVMSCANLQMLLGNVGFECGGVNPIRGQNNVQGACDMGALPNVYPGYQRVEDPAARAKFEVAWGVKLPEKNGLMIPQMIEGLTTGTIKFLYVFGENLANAEPDIRHAEHCLASAEFLVCNDIFPTETTRFADVIFPAAAWSEDDGTFASSERRVSRVRKVSEPPGQAKPNWWIFKELAKRLGHDWTSNNGQEIWDNEVSHLAPILAGIKYYRIEEDGLQWPVPSLDHPGTCIMHQDGCFTCGQGRFMALDWTPPAEVPDKDYPMVLSTGRRLFHYHTRTQTGRCLGLNDLLSEETADISPADAARLGVKTGEPVRVRSRRGEVKVKARVTEEVPPGLVWMSFHFREGNANWLTNPVFDPISQTAELKACAVQIEKA
ncbi:formate dehydrogenase subunit alpha [Desulfobacca acetoxidans]|uniref:Formate dehydrogenase, alpha subunit n=1 Tax=Desulfobacca acetoxidans (strain ATCC 700848 / DSM 11109 / ASRB2) TaxID=880072 RepID=F2NH89_DESAR|nr:formate dehydrogenase subunit alpha [Desulfobacca acetoxidans]AEB08931.1 formate dehydrogenase, alpha subunit [Desulfobacca acetoxidans DSM 11109]